MTAHALPSAALAADLIAAGFVPVPSCSRTRLKARKIPAKGTDGWEASTFTPEAFEKEHGVLLRLGLQPNGLYLYALDLDSHGATQDAWKFLNWIHFKLDESLWWRFFEAKSTGGLYNHNGKAGEFLGQDKLVVYPDDERCIQGSLSTIPVLDDDSVDALLVAAGYRTSEQGAYPITDLEEPADLGTVAANERQLIERCLYVLKPGITRDLITGNRPITNASGARFTCIRGFMFYGFSNAEIEVLAEHFCAWNRSGAKLPRTFAAALPVPQQRCRIAASISPCRPRRGMKKNHQHPGENADDPRVALRIVSLPF